MSAAAAHSAPLSQASASHAPAKLRKLPAEVLAVCRSTGWDLYDARHLAQAEIVARGLVAADPGEWYHHSLLAATLQKQARFGEALATVDDGLARHPGHPQLGKLREEIIASAGRLAEAMKKAADRYGKAASFSPLPALAQGAAANDGSGTVQAARCAKMVRLVMEIVECQRIVDFRPVGSMRM